MVSVNKIAKGLSIVLTLVASTSFATETETFARKQAPVFYDDIDVYTFPSLIMMHKDRLSMTVNDTKNVDSFFGGLSMALTNDSAIGAWVNRGAGVGVDNADATAGLGTLSRMVDVVYGIGSPNDATGMAFFVEHYNEAGDDAWAVALGARYGWSVRNSAGGTDVAFGLGATFGKPTSEFAFAALLDGGYRMISRSSSRLDLVLRTEPYAGFIFAPEMGLDVLLPVYWGPLLKPGRGFTIGAYVGAAVHLSKQAIDGSDLNLNLWAPTVGAAVDWQVSDWLTFHTGFMKSWDWLLVPGDNSKVEESLFNPFVIPYVASRDISAIPGWNIGASLSYKGVTMDVTLATDFLRGGPSPFQKGFWEGMVTGWITLSWDWGAESVALATKRFQSTPAIPARLAPAAQKVPAPAVTPSAPKPAPAPKVTQPAAPVKKPVEKKKTEPEEEDDSWESFD